LKFYTKHLLWIRGLKNAGYPFQADDFPLDQWIDLGRLDSALNQPFQCPFMSSKK